MPRGLGFGSLDADASEDAATGGGGGLTLPPPKPKGSPAPLPKDALASEGARLGFVSREPGKGSAAREPIAAPPLTAAPAVDVDASKDHQAISVPRALTALPVGEGVPHLVPEHADPRHADAKPAPRLKGRRRVAQSKLLIAGRKSVLDEFQQFAWERDLPYWEALALLMERHGKE